MIIDPHVHLRDGQQSHKETVKHGLSVARDSGLTALIDMPNTNPPIISKKELDERKEIYKQAEEFSVVYGIYLGVTSDEEQLKRAIELVRTEQVVRGLKMFAGQSVGDLAIIENTEQRKVYEVLAQEGYEGMLLVHCEKECEMNKVKFDPETPITHCLARPERSEWISVEEQIQYATLANYRGKLHIAHVSTPKSVEAVNTGKENGLDTSCGITFHHLYLSEEQMNQENGILWKMNPPLRRKETQQEMFKLLKEGQINWIETDHAPHTLDEKMNQYMSGIPALPWWPVIIEYLRQQDFGEDQIKDLTFNNANERLELGLEPTERSLVDRRTEYAFNPFAKLESEVQWESLKKYQE